MDKRFWSSRIAGISPYTPGEQPRDRRYIKLNTNENPYPPAPGVLRVIGDFSGADLRLYPDPQCTELRQVLAEHFALSPAEVFVGNGSDEVLAFCFAAFFDETHPVAYADVTYSFYPVYAALFGIESRVIPLDGAFRQPMDEYISCGCGVMLTNPNAPTGTAEPREAVERLVKSDPGRIVIVDEAYVDFGGQSVAGLVTKYDNLLVVHTFSKSRSMAGMRVGYALGDPSLIAALTAVKDSFNSYTLDRVALAAAAESVKDDAYFRGTCARVSRTRDETVRRLRENGFNVLDSNANFVFAEPPGMPASELFTRLLERGILVRHFDKPRISNFLRITIGTDEEMDTLIKTAREILG